MRTLPPSLAASLESGATTLAWCWRLTRRDGVVHGFTEHDRDLTFAGTTFEAAAGMQASEMRSSIGLAVDDLEIDAALSSARLEDGALDAGLYDGATIEIFRVDWTSPEAHLLMRVGSIGEVRRSGQLFTAEVRGLTQHLQQAQGRLFQHTCDAELGDDRCGINLQNPERHWTTTLAGFPSPTTLSVTGPSPLTTGHFGRGVLEVTGGPAVGWRGEIKRDYVVGAEHRLDLWRPLPPLTTVGDPLRLIVGCDKHLATCRDRFSNALNFRGFPHMPGNDYVSSYARAGAPVQSGGRA